MSKPIRLIVADNDTKFSRSLKLFLDEREDIKVINIVRDGQGIVNACKEMLPDIVLMDLHLPVIDSIRAIQKILAQNKFAKILVISSTPNDRYALEAIKAGAFGFIEKSEHEDFQDIVQAIHQIAGGEVFVNPALASHILREFSCT